MDLNDRISELGDYDILVKIKEIDSSYGSGLRGILIQRFNGGAVEVSLGLRGIDGEPILVEEESGLYQMVEGELGVERAHELCHRGIPQTANRQIIVDRRVILDYPANVQYSFEVPETDAVVREYGNLK